MDLETLRNYCLKKPGTSEDFPFGEETLVFKVGTKAFLLTGVLTLESINLKCDPEKAVELRESYEDIIPGYHMNKKHWNTVSLTGRLNDKFVFELIDHSYEMVVKGMSKNERLRIKN